ncbi:MAG: ATP-binding protein, partial [Methanomassiliicoccaceae archaeon]|nr:ATP-binding protein [Methanomassiliicoccaceae archaeon]
MGTGFIGRSRELGLLEKEHGRRRALVLITGRRRVGKTRLIKEFIEGKDALYFLATEQNERLMLNDFSDAISRYSGRVQGEYRNWRDAFSAFAGSIEGKKILVLDEFQNLAGLNGSFLSVLQDIWDGPMSSEEVMLIVCGSHISVMESLDKDVGSPLYGRFTRHITLQPLSFEEVYDGGDYVEALERYAVLGGVPRYMELFDDAPLRENIEANVMDPSSMMFDDPRVLLGGEVKEPASYMSVLKAVAAGNRRISSISSALQVPATTLNPYLKRLIDIRLVRRSVPVTENDPEKSKSGLYSIDDMYTAFWFRFVHPYSSELSLGHSGWAMSEYDRRFVEDHVSFVFESVCRDSVRGMGGQIGFVPIKVGSYWDKNTEIDVVALNTAEKKAFVAECKYHRNTPVSHHVLRGLRGKCATLRELEGYDVVFGLFSVSGFDDRLLREEGIVLVDRGE